MPLNVISEGFRGSERVRFFRLPLGVYKVHDVNVDALQILRWSIHAQ